MFGFGESDKKESKGEPPSQEEAPSPAAVEIHQLLSSSTILIEKTPGKKSELLKNLVQLISQKNSDVPIETAFQAVMEREKVTSTFMDNGIGLPHARMAKIKKISAALAVIPPGLSDPKEKKKGGEKEANDNNPKETGTQFVFLFLSPQGEFTAHLQTLSRASWLFQNQKLRDQLINASSTSDALTFIKETEKSYQNGSVS